MCDNNHFNIKIYTDAILYICVIYGQVGNKSNNSYIYYIREQKKGYKLETFQDKSAFNVQTIFGMRMCKTRVKYTMFCVKMGFIIGFVNFKV